MPLFEVALQRKYKEPSLTLSSYLYKQKKTMQNLVCPEIKYDDNVLHTENALHKYNQDQIQV